MRENTDQKNSEYRHFPCSAPLFNSLVLIDFVRKSWFLVTWKNITNFFGTSPNYNTEVYILILEITRVILCKQIGYMHFRSSFQWLKVCYCRQPLRKIPNFHSISWCRNFVEPHCFDTVFGDSPETLQKLCVSKYFHSRKLSDITVFYAVNSAVNYKVNYITFTFSRRKLVISFNWKTFNYTEII